jgi:hypothetical protein
VLRPARLNGRFTVQGDTGKRTTLGEDAQEINEEVKVFSEQLDEAASGVNALNLAFSQSAQVIEESKKELKKSPRTPREKEVKTLALKLHTDESTIVENVSRDLLLNIQATEDLENNLVGAEKELIVVVDDFRATIPSARRWVQQQGQSTSALALPTETSLLIQEDLPTETVAPRSRSSLCAQGFAMLNRGLLAVNSLLTSCLSFAHVTETNTPILALGSALGLSGGVACTVTIAQLCVEWDSFPWKDFFSLKVLAGGAATLKPFVDALSAVLHIMAAEHMITAVPSQVAMLGSNVCALTQALVGLYQERKKSGGDDSPTALTCANPSLECGMQGSAVITHLTGIAFNPLVATMIGATGIGGKVVFGVGTMVAAFFSIVVLIFFCVILLRRLCKH